MSITTRIRGKDKLLARLKSLSKTIESDLGMAANEAADEMVVVARRLAPKRTGALAKSIAATYGGQMTPPHSQPGGSTLVPPTAAMVTAGNDEVRYPHLVEFGSAPHPQGGWAEGTDHPGTAPRPFFFPAYRLIRKRANRKMAKALRKAVEGSAR